MHISKAYWTRGALHTSKSENSAFEMGVLLLQSVSTVNSEWMVFGTLQHDGTCFISHTHQFLIEIVQGAW